MEDGWPPQTPIGSDLSAARMSCWMDQAGFLRAAQVRLVQGGHRTVQPMGRTCSGSAEPLTLATGS